MPLDVFSPLTGRLLYSLTEPDSAEITRLREQARGAQRRVADLSIQVRAEAVVRLQHVIQERQEMILDRIVAETGKTRFDALSSEFFGVLDACAHFARIAPAALADQSVHTPLILMGKKSQVWLEPLGTVLVIAPWNYPFYQLLVPAICAFLAGNAVLLKPSELTPLQGLFEDLFRAAEFPSDAVQIVYGGKTTGQALIDSRPEHIFFTGSVESGRRIMAQAAQYLIPVSLELGGKDPMLVFADAPLERAVQGALWGGLTTSGQSCTSVERIYVERSLYPRFIEKLQAKIEKLRLLAHTPEPADVGYMTAPFQIAVIEAQLAEAVAAGARILCGGSREPGAQWFPPTLVVDVTHDMSLMRAETFGPVLAVMPFDSEEQAIALANDSDYGLSASVWSADPVLAERVARQLRCGNISINNVMLTEANPALPFGGLKDSGFGRYKGVWGLEAFCHLKSVMIDSASSKIEANWYPYTAARYRVFSALTEALFSRRPSLLSTLLKGLKIESLAQKEKL
jgi:acyl-CoA reductase-like NAD-dependent aldehyde dehydrogenase